MKTIKVMLEIPKKWVDVEDPMFGLGFHVRQAFEKVLRKAVGELIEKGFKLPKVKDITREEIREKMMEILAERAIEEISVKNSGQ